jgi:hypothetical protein
MLLKPNLRLAPSLIPGEICGVKWLKVAIWG